MLVNEAKLFTEHQNVNYDKTFSNTQGGKAIVYKVNLNKQLMVYI